MVDLKKSLKNLVVLSALVSALSNCASTGIVSKEDAKTLKPYITKRFDIKKLAQYQRDIKIIFRRFNCYY